MKKFIALFLIIFVFGMVQVTDALAGQWMVYVWGKDGHRGTNKTASVVVVDWSNCGCPGMLRDFCSRNSSNPYANGIYVSERFSSKQSATNFAYSNTRSILKQFNWNQKRFKRHYSSVNVIGTLVGTGRYSCRFE